MYNIRQFKPALYVLVLFGITGFALASQSPIVWLIGCGGVLVNAWLVHTGRFKPLPRLVANAITVLSMVVVARQLFGTERTSAVLVIGQFLVALQLVKFWEQRANRDFGQLLVLSLLLMVAASINTSSLFFGLLLVGYLFLSLYCCLLFHLKVETDAAKAAVPLPEEKVPPAQLRQDQRFLTQSMRRLTGIVSGAAVVMAVVVFLFFPRGTGANMLAPVQSAAQTLTGFTEEIHLTDVTQISQNNAVVAHVEMYKVEAGQPDQRQRGPGADLLLRGVTLNVYDAGRGRWVRRWGDPSATENFTVYRDNTADLKKWPDPDDVKDVKDAADRLAAADKGDKGDKVTWRQKVMLEPTNTKTLFAVAGPVSLSTRRDVRVQHDADGVLQTPDPPQGVLEYEVVSTGQLERYVPREGRISRVPPEIAEYARRPEVTGSDATGPLAARVPGPAASEDVDRRPRARPPHPLDGEIADNIVKHLRGPGFTYTLDTSDAKGRKGADPYVWFLTSPDGHRGHCEYYAGAMALMCQSLGMNARVVTGFRCDDYNETPGAGYYIVRQSHAHAWVEVLTTDGWKTYDPTSGRAENDAVKKADLLTKVKHFFDFLEYTYATNVIAYDNENRENLIQAVEQRMTNPIYNRINRGSGSFTMPGLETVQQWAGSVVNVVVGLTILALLALGGWVVWQQLKLRRRAQRIGIVSLPADEQLRLARQLGFYDDLIRLLGRHKIARAPHQTPMEFARSLLFLPSDVYEQVRRLTGVFYRVRFGKADLSAAQQKRLGNVIGRVEAALGEVLPARR